VGRGPLPSASVHSEIVLTMSSLLQGTHLMSLGRVLWVRLAGLEHKPKGERGEHRMGGTPHNRHEAPLSPEERGDLYSKVAELFPTVLYLSWTVLRCAGPRITRRREITDTWENGRPYCWTLLLLAMPFFLSLSSPPFSGTISSFTHSGLLVAKGELGVVGTRAVLTAS